MNDYLKNIQHHFNDHFYNRAHLSQCASINPTARQFHPRNPPTKEEEIEKNNGTPPDTKPYHDDKPGCMYVYGKDSSPVESTRLDQDSMDIRRKQAEVSKMIVTQQARSLSPSHRPPMFSGDVMSYPSLKR